MTILITPIALQIPTALCRRLTVSYTHLQGEKEVAGSAVITIAPAELTIAVLDQSVPVGAAVPSLETPAAGTHYTVSVSYTHLEAT